jgi:hypothetical protein
MPGAPLVEKKATQAYFMHVAAWSLFDRLAAEDAVANH